MKLEKTALEATELFRAGRREEARRLCVEAVARKTVVDRDVREARAWDAIGTVLGNLGACEAAAQAFGNAAGAHPGFVDAHVNRAIALQRLGRHEEALGECERAVGLAPSHARALFIMASVLERMGRADEAIAANERVLAIQGDFAPAYLNIGTIHCLQDRTDAALAMLQRAIEIDPAFVEAHRNLGAAYKQLGDVDAALACYRRAVELRPDFAAAWSSMLLVGFGRHPYDAQEHFAQHVEFGRRFGRAAGGAYANGRDPGRRIRVGYVSPDFREHPVGTFLAGVIENHDAAKIERFCYTNSPTVDDVTRRIQGACEHWRDIHMSDDDAAAEMVRADGIDVLVDLAGHTGNNRILLFARRPAPVQVSYLGYMGTTGLPAIGFRITDACVDPPGITERFHTEKLVRLAGAFFAYSPRADAPPVARPADGPITFASFNLASKIGDEAARAWSRILQATPGSRLRLSGPKSAQACQRLFELFERYDIPRERLELVARQPYAEYLRTVGESCVVLDPFPINGHTTTCDSLWMGVPVVTLAGDNYVSRLGVSVLTHLGTPELIAATVDDYVAVATSLAQSPGRLLEYRERLRPLMRERLCDGRRVAGELDEAYGEMWRAWCGSAAR